MRMCGISFYRLLCCWILNALVNKVIAWISPVIAVLCDLVDRCLIVVRSFRHMRVDIFGLSLYIVAVVVWLLTFWQTYRRRQTLMSVWILNTIDSYTIRTSQQHQRNQEDMCEQCSNWSNAGAVLARMYRRLRHTNKLAPGGIFAALIMHSKYLWTHALWTAFAQFWGRAQSLAHRIRKYERVNVPSICTFHMSLCVYT